MAYQYTNPATGKMETAPSKEWYETNKGLLFPGTSSYTGTQTPITAGGLTNEPSLNLSNIQTLPPATTTRAITDITNTASSYQQIIDQARKQQMELLKQPTADVSGTQAQLMTQYGVDTNLQQLQALAPEIADLNDKVAKLDAREQADLAQLIGQPISQGFAIGMEGRIKRQYAAERAGLAGMLGAKTAMAAMYQGNISTAQNMINSTINALTYDVSQQRQDMDKLYDFYGDFINSLEKKDQIALQNAREDLIRKETQQRADYKDLLNIMMENPQAGITPFDTLEEAATKVSQNPKITGVGTGIMGSITPEQLSPLAKMVYEGTYKLSDLTPTDKRAIAPELQAVGFTYAMANEDRNTISYIANEMENVMKNWNAIPNILKAPITGNITSALGSERYSNAVATFNASRGIVGMALTRLFEKGRISDQDRTFYLSLMPKIGTTKAVAEAGKNELIRLLKEKLTNQIKDLTPTEGGDNDPLGIL